MRPPRLSVSAAWRSKLARGASLLRNPRFKERCIPPWRPFAVFLSLYILFLLLNPWWRLLPRPRSTQVAHFENVIELPHPIAHMRPDQPMEFMNAALVPCAGYMGAFARLNDPVHKMSWPLWMPLDTETLQPLAESWTRINITDWVPLDGRGFRSSGYEDLRVVRHKGQIWTSGTASFRVHGRSYGEYRPLLVAWNEPKGMEAPVPTEKRFVLTEVHAKNWGPFVEDEQLYIFQDAQPFRICLFNQDHCDIIAEIPHTLRPFSPSLLQAPTLRAARIIGKIPTAASREHWEYLGVAHYRVNRWKSSPYYYFLYFIITLHDTIRVKRFSSIISFEELGAAPFWYLHTSFIRPRPVATLERLNLAEMCKQRPHNTNCFEVVSSISPGDFGAFLTVQSLPAVLDMFPS